MPAFSPFLPTLQQATQAAQNLTADLFAQQSDATNNTSTANTVQVICAWPVSGQYGPGSRFLYYALVAACLLGRQAEWLRNACLAAALLFPAVAALHGMVMAAVHVDGAIDMDVYGSFQLCAIGILAGPVTVRLSETYFYTPGRNMIFVWAIMILAGLLSLTVEFFRATPVSCPAEEFTWDPVDGNTSICGLTCDVDAGPFSPLRGGSQNNIYVIQAPDIVPLGSATLLAAACCIPAILSLVSTWIKIQKTVWKQRWGRGQEDSENNIAQAPTADGNNHTTLIASINDKVRFFLSMIEVPLFGIMVLLIIIFGERNFFSHRVSYNTEPIASVGQWAPIVGTGLAAVGSLYGLLARGDITKAKADPKSSRHDKYHCPCPHHPLNHSEETDNESLGDSSSQEIARSVTYRASREFRVHGIMESSRRRPTDASSVSPTRPWTRTTATNPTDQDAPHHEHFKGHHPPENLPRRSDTLDTTGTSNRVARSRMSVAQAFERVGELIGTPAPNRFNDDILRSGPAAEFPTTPGEEYLNRELRKMQDKYHNATQLERQRSRNGSFVGGAEGSQGIHGQEGYPHHRHSTSELYRMDTWAGPGTRRGSVDRSASPAPARRATLEPPKPIYHHSPSPRTTMTFDSSHTSRESPGNIQEGPPNSPTIVVSKASDQPTQAS